MSEQIHTASRRKFLKGAAYASALSIAGVSGLALADTVNPQQGVSDVSGLHTVTLRNQSNRPVALDAKQPVSLEQVQGWVVVKLNKISEQSATEYRHGSSLVLAEGQQRSFVVDSKLAPALHKTGSHIVITNEYSSLDNMVPMATYDVVVV